MLSFTIVLWASSMLQFTDAAKVLFFNGMGEGSHYSAAVPIAEALVSRGVSVTFIISEAFRYHSEHPLHSSIFQFEIIQTRATRDDFEGRPGAFVEAALRGAPMIELASLFISVHEKVAEDCQDLFQEETLHRLKAEEFDLAVYDPSWPCSILLAEYLGVTKVSFIPTALAAGIVRFHGNPLNPALFAEPGLGLPARMDFWTRMKNLFLTGLMELMMTHRPGYDDIREMFKLQNDWREAAITTALVLPSSDPIIDLTIPTMPHVKLVGGVITRPSEPLPENLEDFVQSSGDHGVIIFCLGGYVRHLPEDMIRAFQEAFSKLPQKVFWQWKGPEPPTNMPENVRTMSWLPQNDLLGHNRTKLLIFQGGNNGLYEAIYHGVPLLVLPFIADQPDVAQRVFERGVGLELDVTKVTSELILDSVTTILSDPSYEAKMDRMSAIFRDRPHHPRDRAAFWIEHVIKYGAEHLKSPVHDLNFIQLNMIDVYLFLAVVVSSIVLVVYRVLKFICSTLWLKCCSKGKRKSD